VSNTAAGTKGKIVACKLLEQLERRSFFFWLRIYRCMRKSFTKVQPCRLIFTAKQAIMPDLGESLWQNVKKETPDEFIGFDGHQFFLFLITVIPPFEGDISILKLQNPVV
jgi:hypothetical protein